MLLSLALVSSNVLAYSLDVRSDNPLVTEAELKGMVVSASTGVPHHIPHTQQVYVYVMTRAKPRFLDPNRYLFFHRVELRRHFKSGDPYTVNAWLPIKREELYGEDNAEGVKQALKVTLRRFFADVNNLNVNVEFKKSSKR
ncbi:MAG: hypothetical protein ACRETN_09040 [Nevskiales bacterium]